MSVKQYPHIAEMFRDRVKLTPDADAFYAPHLKTEVWKTYTWKQVYGRVRAMTSGLKSIGVESEERIAISSTTRLEWLLADLAVGCSGGAVTTVYPSNTPEEVAFIMTDSGTTMVFAENNDQVKKLIEVREQIPDVKKVIVFDGNGGHDGWVISLAELEEAGAAYDEANPDDFDKVIDGIKPEHLATLIYTSGTTGQPKGVELIHDCWGYEGWAIAECGVMKPTDKQFLWLPMSHSFGKVLLTAILQIGIPTAVDGRIDKIIDNLGVVKPTFMAAAPRIFEKVYNKVVVGAQESGGLKLRIFRWAMKVGKEVSRIRQGHREPGGLLALKYAIADKLVFSKLRARFGDNIEYFISGSAPLSRDMAEFFHAAGMLIMEGYGLTESSAASFVNLPATFAFGTVGKPLPGTEVKIAESDGEILIRGRGVMRGYWNLPEVTKETKDADGWLLTGDIGELDSQGRLKITDRKKDLIKTSGGKYVAPQKLEARLKVLCTLVSQVVVHGNQRNFCSALVTVDEENLVKWAEERGLSGSYEELATSDEVHAFIAPFVEQLNGELARYETVKKFAVLPSDFSVENGEMTPSMKIKRKVVENNHKAVLDGFYEGALAAV